MFFADDSTQSGRRNGMGKLVAVGGILLEWQAVRVVTTKIDTLARDAGLPAGTELKWSPPPENWLYSHLHGQARTELYTNVLRAVRELGAKVCVVVWDTGRTSLTGTAAFEKAVDYLFERLTTNASKNNSHFVVVSDRPGGGKRQEEAFLDDFVARTESGTEYVTPDRCLLNVLTTPSHLLRHLQVADIVVGATTSMIAGSYRYAAPVFAEIRPMFIRNALQYAGGTGLKLFPDALTNLYRWTLEESAFTKAATGTGFALPDPSYPYFEDDTPR